jgi:hypothetical protein
MNTSNKLAILALATIGVVLLVLWSLDAFGFRSPVFAFLLNWLAMSWVALAGQAIPFALPASYYNIKTFERTGRVYERLGLPFFKKLVRRGPLAIFSPTLRFPKVKTISALQNLDHEMQKAEAGHVYVFLLMLVFIGYALLHGWFDAVVWMLVFNVLINGYPIMLQRYNRIMLQQLIQRQCLLIGQEESSLHD